MRKGLSQAENTKILRIENGRAIIQAPVSSSNPPRSDQGMSRSGQAAIEFAVGLLLLLIVLTGIIHINLMARTSLFLHAVLRNNAGEQAMQDGAASIAPPYLTDWAPGPDGLRYTADDQKLSNGMGLPNTLSTLTRYSVRAPNDWSYVTDDSRLPVSMVQLNASPLMAATLGFVHSEETLDVPVDPVIRQLVYGKDVVTIKEEVWMPLMGGLY
jgi:hypothetical protein